MFIRFSCLSLASLMFVASGSTFADDSADSKALVEKILKASGGEENLGKIKAEIYSAKGQLLMGPMPMAYTIEFKQAFPLKCRYDLTMEGDSGKMVNILACDGKVGWSKSSQGGDQDMDEAAVKSICAAFHKNWLTTALPLKDPSLTVTSLGASKIGETEVNGLKVVAKDRPDVNLYFDAKTNLLVQSSYKSTPPGMDEAVDTVQEFSNHKEVAGVQIPMKNKVIRGGKPYMEFEYLEIKFVDKLDDSIFQKPKESEKSEKGEKAEKADK